ncbi:MULTISPECIES: hypothetical protein [Paraburkholderia]|uniref:Uncharacterized protein n=1 Tax=Paraburkholderia madseniana TaxID=2599607 RepID=A0AAP5BC14_9BURK|nr:MULTISPECIES: hypothetical protein [Paraburkholderia]MCX4146928.1 hypothetical protein [Paraburkholderia madseniana]MDN7149873.1 hypothetical protein [Paraburkholderia sp. WS6]MDQ6408753.1 hypothetical protein [Paraburkholderia madseniana]
MLLATLLSVSAALAAVDAQTAERDHAELQLAKARVAQLTDEISRLKAEQAASSAQATAGSVAYEKYLASFYDQESRFRDSYLRISAWQIFAANCVLALVMLLSISGVVFAGFQLWTAAKLAHTDATTVNLEVSRKSVRLQTSVVGIAILVISGGFLILFLHDVYRIDIVTPESEPHAAAANPSQPASHP